MREDIITYAEIISKFCRLQMNMKRDIPIRASEMGALIFVVKSGEPVTPAMISCYFGISKPSVTDMINSLIKKDYLIKMPSDKDKRSYIVSPTQKGIELVETTFREYVRTIELLEEKMGFQEFKMFIEMVEMANKILSRERES